LAAYGVSPQPCTWQNAIQINVLDSIMLIERAIEAGVPRIILSGSCMEYGRSAERFDNIPPNAPLEPTGPYAASKAALSVAASALCQQRRVELAILRLFTVFGDGQNPGNLWPSMHRAALAGEDFPMSPGEQISDFVPVEDVGHLYQLDFKPLIKSRRDPLHLPLLNVPTFKKVFCNGLTIEWPTGLDICPDALRRWCEAGEIIQEDILSIA
jgi:nucleoside-diphosphate-sugar epimerase